MPAFDDVRRIALGLPETEERITWEVDITFRVRDKIYLITGQDGGGASIRTDKAQQTDLLAAFPEAVSVAPYVGRFGWVNVSFDRIDPEIVKDIIRSAWRRTAPKAVVQQAEGALR